MPHGFKDQTVHVGRTSDIEGLNVSELPRTGELGKHLWSGGAAYQLVKLDSGATASALGGAVADGQLAFWKDRANKLVTNDKNQAVGGPVAATARNAVAGVFTVAVTAGYFCAIKKKGRHSVKTDGGGDFAVGDFIVPSSNDVPDGDRTASGTAPPVTAVGRVAAVEAAGKTSCDLDLPIDEQ